MQSLKAMNNWRKNVFYYTIASIWQCFDTFASIWHRYLNGVNITVFNFKTTAYGCTSVLEGVSCPTILIRPSICGLIENGSAALLLAILLNFVTASITVPCVVVPAQTLKSRSSVKMFRRIVGRRGHSSTSCNTGAPRNASLNPS